MNPILDNHCHLDSERGMGIAAVEDFSKSGGTHMLIVNQHSWKDGKNPTDIADFEERFYQTMEIVERATEILQGRAWSVLGIHPALISRLVEGGQTAEEAGEFMCDGLNIAAGLIGKGDAIALKSGRPHYEVSEEIWEISNVVLRHAISLAAKMGIAVQLHTETTEDLSEVSDWAMEMGLPWQKIVKHFAGGSCRGVTPSVISRMEELERAIRNGKPFMMETDYLDDPRRPGAVLGIKTVPKRTKLLRESGHERLMEMAHVETPKMVYGIETKEAE